MLRITQSNSAARAQSYYSTADYYTEGQELVGQWQGKGAAMLGLAGRVERSDWDALCENMRPDNGSPLTVRRKTERRVGYDFNFHCPKSVSLLYGATQDARVLEAFQEAVQETMADIEAEAQSRVRRNGRNEDRVTGNLAWGEYVHFTSRPVDGVPDPHLHAHCFVFNATFDAAEGRWKAAQLGGIKRDAPYFEAVFHSILARRLEEQGFATERTATGWELQGLAAATLDKFSRRTAQIEAAAEEKGITDPQAKAELGAQTRSRKAADLTMPQLRGLWMNRMSPEERAALDAVSQRSVAGRLPEDGQGARDAVQRTLEHCFERASVVPERTLMAEALRRGVGRASRQSVEQLIAAQPLIRATRHGRAFVTTRQVLAEEDQLLTFARQGRGACRPLNPGRTTFRRDWLNKQQKDAVRHVLQSRDSVIVIRGAAGTGKTTMMQEAREAIEEAGVHVHAFAPSAGASRGVLRSEGFGSADTVARLLADPKLQAEMEGGVIWIDEAGLLGTRTLLGVFECAGQHHARVVLSGDRRQHGSVERGAALRLLEEEAGIRPAEIKEIQRQRDEYKLAVKALSEGRTDEGFRRLDDLGWVREVDEEGRYKALADAYLDALATGKTALVVSPTHAEGAAVTAAIRSTMRSRGLLGSQEHEIAKLLPANLTLGERHDPASYRPGDVLVFHQNAKGHRKGDRLIAGTTPLPLDQAERFTVYRSGSLRLSAGDRVRITKNGATKDGGHRLDNGDLFTVKGFTKSGDLLLDNGWRLDRNYGHMDYGLVVTSHASQGKTVDRVFIGQSSRSFAASSREQFYVSASRGREQVLVFTDDKAGLLDAVERSDERLTGTELLQGLSGLHHHHVRELAEQAISEAVTAMTPAHAPREEYAHER